MVNSGRAKHASLGGGVGVLPQNFFEKVSALRLSGGIWQPSINHSCDSTCTSKLPVKSGTGDCGYRYR